MIGLTGIGVNATVRLAARRRAEEVYMLSSLSASTRTGPGRVVRVVCSLSITLAHRGFRSATGALEGRFYR